MQKFEIDTIDTAIDYGNSEIKLGMAGVKDFKVVTKIPSIDPKVHDVSYLIKNRIMDSLEKLKT